MRQRIILGLGFTAFFATSGLAEISISNEVPNIRLGMSKADLFAARPDIKFKGMMGEPLDTSKPELTLFEDLKSTTSVFSAVSYSVEGEKLIGVGFHGYPKKGDEKATRKKAIRDAKALYGQPKKKRVPEDPIRKGKGIAAFIWEKENHEILLLLPVRREKKDSTVSPVSLQIRPIRAKNKALDDMSLSQSEKDSLLKENDGDDMGPTK